MIPSISREGTVQGELEGETEADSHMKEWLQNTGEGLARMEGKSPAVELMGSLETRII